MGIKLVLLLILGITASVWAYPKTACGSGPQHNLVEGSRESGDRLLFVTRLVMPRALLRVRSSDFKWPRNSRETFNHITRFEVHDQLHDGTGGCAFRKRGGVGKNHLKLHIKSQKGGRFDFVIYIYGK